MLIKQPADRIWELFKQSGIDIGEDQEGNIEKFADLIVKECSGIVQNYMSRLPEDHKLTKRIKEHFGVKE
jgi:hypothetical protein